MSAPAGERWLFAGLILVQLVPVFGVSHFLTQDGPAHVDSANVLRRYASPEHPLYRTVYERNPSLEPNLLGHALSALLLFALPAAAVEKLLVALCVVGLPLAVRYALRGVDRGGAWAAALVFPFVFNWPLHMGFYNFSLSLPVFFWTLGLWWRRRQSLEWRHVAALAGLGLLLYVSHVVSLVLALVVILVLFGWLERPLPALLRRGARTLLALSPALLLLGEFLTRKGAAVPPPQPLAESWRALRAFEAIVVFGGAERWLAPLVFWGLVAVAALALFARLRSWSPVASDAWLLAALAAAVVYLAAPRGLASGAALKERLILYPPLLLLPWLAAQPFSARAKALLQGAGALAAIALLGARFPVQRALDGQLQEYLSVRESIRPGTLLLPLCYEARGLDASSEPLAEAVRPFIHAAGYLAAERDALQLANYEGNKGHFPIVFRPDWNPYTRLGPYGGIEAEPPCVEFRDFGKSAGRPIEYVLTWGLETYERREAPLWSARPHKFREARACLASVREQLLAGYELVDVSEPNGWARLYKRR